MEEEYLALAIGICATLAFPLIVVAAHARRDRRRNRKMGTRRTDKIKLTKD